MSESAVSFEKAVEELESIIEALEKGELTLEVSIKSYENGMKLCHICQKILSDSEHKVYILREGKQEEILAETDTKSKKPRKKSEKKSSPDSDTFELFNEI